MREQSSAMVLSGTGIWNMRESGGNRDGVDGGPKAEGGMGRGHRW
jgi:hypothetical protein